MSKNFPNPLAPRRMTTPSGSDLFPEFVEKEQDVFEPTGKMTNVYKKIQTYKDEVLLENILKRCLETGETLSVVAPSNFGDTTKMPKTLLEAHDQLQKADSFVNSLSEDDQSFLMEKGFDAFLSDKIKKMQSSQEVKAQSKEVKADE